MVQKAISWNHRIVWQPEQVLCHQFHGLQGQAKECLPPLHSLPENGESLKDYVRRFNLVVLEVEDPSDKVVVMAMMEGLRPT